MQVKSFRPHERQLLEQKNTSHVVKIGPPFFHSSPFYPTPKILCFTLLFNWSDISTSALPVGTPTSPCNRLHVPWTSQTRRSILHLDRLSRYSTAHDNSVSFTMCVKTLLKPNSITLSGSNQLRTSFEPAPNQLA